MKRTFLGYSPTSVHTFLLIAAAIVVWFSFLILYVYLAQDPGYREIFINHSGRKLTIIEGDRKIDLADGAMTEPMSGQWVFRIETEKGETWEYKWAPIKSREYVIQRTFYCQVESDGSIYLLPFIANGPSEDLPSQPEGYPRRPRILH
jgi:hypothetical protein